jgi:recombination protein RecR
MSLYPESFQQIIEIISSLPGIGKKGAEKLALAIYSWPDEKIDHFSKLISSLNDEVHNCSQCGFLSQNKELCPICINPARDGSKICVVEQVSQVPVIEKSGSFKGLYHVLHGKLSPLKGIGPEDINIENLIARCSDNEVNEVILATGTDIEGQATASYLAKILNDQGVSTTRIAQGIPIGADLNYADAASIAMAINSRREL